MATWFNKTTIASNIDAVSGGTTSSVWYDRAADTGGNWMDTSVLTAGGSTVLCANNHSLITANIDIDLGTGKLSTVAEVGTYDTGAAGGGFKVTAAQTITATIQSGSTVCLTASHTTGTVTVNGTITGGASTNAYGFLNSAAGTVVVEGNVSGGTGAATYGFDNRSTGSVTITGDVSGSTGSTSHGLRNFSTGPITVTGDITGGRTTTTLSAANGILSEAVATLTITGNVTGGTGPNTMGIRNFSTGAVTITGSVLGGSGVNAYGFTNATSGVAIINGGNLINTTTAGSHSGQIIYNPGSGNYVEFPRTSGTNKLYIPRGQSIWTNI